MSVSSVCVESRFVWHIRRIRHHKRVQETRLGSNALVNPVEDNKYINSDLWHLLMLFRCHNIEKYEISNTNLFIGMFTWFPIETCPNCAVNNTAPEYLCDLIRLNVKSTTIRTRASFDPCLLCVPPISKMCANSFFDRSFVYAAPTLWNALDLDIRLLPFDAFKKRVKTHLYLKYLAN